MNEEQARKRVDELKGYYGHLGSFVGVNLFLFTINMMDYSNSGQIWFVYPLFGWGVGLVVHTFTVFGTGRDWESRKMQELTGLSHTRDELEKLAERTDILITILSDINWDKVDPELMETGRNLQAAKRRIGELRDGPNDRDSEAEVTREIEKLEQFVTSPQFEYLDRIQSR